MGNKISNVKLTKLDMFKNADGAVQHIIREDSEDYVKFGEAYLSSVNYGKVKAWKRHNLMTLNLVVISGCIQFVIFDDRKDSDTYGLTNSITIFAKDFLRLTIGPKLWVGFYGLSDGLNQMLNIADVVHDPSEFDRIPVDAIPFSWG